MSKALIEIKELKKEFDGLVVFENFNFIVEQGDFIMITGKSGSGKSTLLNIIGLLTTWDKGEISRFGEVNVKPFTRQAELLLRNRIGYLFQNYALVDNESVRYNLSMVLNQKLSKNEKEKQILAVLDKFSLSESIDKKVYKCSGGEQQRISIARLMLKKCDLILADEPTGSLDDKNTELIMKILKDLHKQGKTILMVTHNTSLLPYGTRTIALP